MHRRIKKMIQTHEIMAIGGIMQYQSIMSQRFPAQRFDNKCITRRPENWAPRKNKVLQRWQDDQRLVIEPKSLVSRKMGATEVSPPMILEYSNYLEDTNRIAISNAKLPQLAQTPLIKSSSSKQPIRCVSNTQVRKNLGNSTDKKKVTSKLLNDSIMT